MSPFASRLRPTKNRPSRSSKPRAPRAAAAAAGPSGRLEDQLCFAVYAASNAIGRAYAPLLRPLGLTYLQYLVVLVLLEHRELAVGEIGTRLFLDSGTLTPVLRRLEAAGFITRRRSAFDEREVRVGLTDAARQIEPALDAVRAELACRMALTAPAFAALRAQLHDLRAQIVAGTAGAA
jgi:DNA-binding MarR family transcriptional regulator